MDEKFHPYMIDMLDNSCHYCPEDLISKIDHVLFTEDCLSVSLHYKTYKKLAPKLDKSRYKPETDSSMLSKYGIVGYLLSPNKEISKPIVIDKSAEPGKVYGSKPF